MEARKYRWWHVHVMAKATDYQKAQAIQSLQTGLIEEIVGRRLYRVPSSRPNNQGYYVYYGTPRTCTCDHYFFASKEEWKGKPNPKYQKNPVCSHIKAVGYFRGNKQ